MELNSIDKYTGLTLLCVSLKITLKSCFNTVDRYFDILDNILYNYKGEFENA